MIQLFTALSHPTPSEWRFGVLLDGAALCGAEAAEFAAMRRHEVDGMQRRVAKAEKVPQLVRYSLLVFKRSAVWRGPGDFSSFGHSERKCPSFDGVSVDPLY